MKQAARVMGARVVKTIYMGFAGKERGQILSQKQLKQAESAAASLIR